jgi:hypothetical protein
MSLRLAEASANPSLAERSELVRSERPRRLGGDDRIQAEGAVAPH